MFWWDVLRRQKDNFFWWFLYCAKYKDRFSDWCRWICRVVTYYLVKHPFKNQIINIKNNKDDWNISDFLSRYFGMKIGKIMTCLSCHQNKSHKILKDDYFIILLDIITLNNKQAPFCRDKMTYLAMNCVTMKELLDKLHEKQSWVM